MERILETLPTVTERYFETKYFLPSKVAAEAKGDAEGEERGLQFDDKVEDQCVLFHSNRICVIALAPSHPILKEKKRVTLVDYKGSPNQTNRMNNKVTGKWKKGGQKLKEDSLICTITCADDSIYSIVASIKGNLIEINEQLLTEPQLLVDLPWADGYIAILLPHMNMTNSLKDSLRSREDYEKAMESREK